MMLDTRTLVTPNVGAVVIARALKESSAWLLDSLQEEPANVQIQQAVLVEMHKHVEYLQSVL